MRVVCPLVLLNLKTKLKKSNMTREKEKIIRDFQKKPPVRIFSLARALGLEIYKHEFPNNISGCIEREEGGSYVIFTNENHHINRRRFTVAHEIAHYLLHRDMIEDGVVDDILYRSNLSGSLEKEANSYAAQLLMPRHLILEAIKEGIDSIKELADKFRVSEAAMSIRTGIPSFPEK